MKQLPEATEGCHCDICIIVRGRTHADREFDLRDTEPPKPRSSVDSAAEQIRLSVQEELKKWGGM